MSGNGTLTTVPDVASVLVTTVCVLALCCCLHATSRCLINSFAFLPPGRSSLNPGPIRYGPSDATVWLRNAYGRITFSQSHCGTVCVIALRTRCSHKLPQPLCVQPSCAVLDVVVASTVDPQRINRLVLGDFCHRLAIAGVDDLILQPVHDQHRQADVSQAMYGRPKYGVSAVAVETLV